MLDGSGRRMQVFPLGNGISIFFECSLKFSKWNMFSRKHFCLAAYEADVYLFNSGQLFEFSFNQNFTTRAVRTVNLEFYFL